MATETQTEKENPEMDSLLPAQKMQDMTKGFEVEGILVPISWSGKNQVKETAMYSAGEKEYLIDSGNKKGQELNKLYGNRLKIRGTLTEKETVPHKLLVESYEVLDF